MVGEPVDTVNDEPKVALRLMVAVFELIDAPVA